MTFWPAQWIVYGCRVGMRGSLGAKKPAGQWPGGLGGVCMGALLASAANHYLLPFSVRLQTTALRHGGGHQALFPGLGPLQSGSFWGLYCCCSRTW